nr:hypothetical protein [Tanacetum cinerariifolium]
MVDMISNGVFRATLDVDSIIDKMREGRLRWFGHVKRKTQSASVRRVEAMVVEGSRIRGGPKLRWEDRLKMDMKELRVSEDMTFDKNAWRDRIRISSKTMVDMISNGVFRATLDVDSIIDKMREGRLRWFGHVKRKTQSASVRRVEAMVVEGSRIRGRPKLRWEDRLKMDMKELRVSEDMTFDKNARYSRVIKDMYEGEKTCLRTTIGNSKYFSVKVGFHQGSAISPYLFTLILDEILRGIQENIPWCMIFADDIVLIAESAERLNNRLESWRKKLEDNGLRVSREKMEYPRCDFGR